MDVLRKDCERYEYHVWYYTEYISSLIPYSMGNKGGVWRVKPLGETSKLTNTFLQDDADFVSFPRFCLAVILEQLLQLKCRNFVLPRCAFQPSQQSPSTSIDH